MVDGDTWLFTEAFISSKQKAYPKVDVLKELWKIQGKTSDTPQARPERVKINGYVDAWLQNETNKLENPKNPKGRQMMATNEEYKEIAKEWNGKC